VALGPIRTACTEVHREGERREHARFARWQLTRLVDPTFEALDLDAMARDIAQKTTPAGLLVKWNKYVGSPLGALTTRRVAAIERDISVAKPSSPGKRNVRKR
jgi:hypothetical protein